MNLHVRKTVEFDKIVKKISDMAVCAETASYILRIKPSSDPDLCMKWLRETDSAVRYSLKHGRIPLRPVRAMDQPLRIARSGGTVYNKELLGIKDIIHVSRCVKEHSDDPDEMESAVEDLIGQLYSNKRLEDRISAVIISEDDISDDASPELRSIRKSILREQDLIKEKLGSFIRNPAFSKYLQEPLITMRRDRYVIPVKTEYRNEIKGLVHNSSASGQTLFVEPLTALESNNRVEELKSREQAEIGRILKELSGEVGIVADNIVKTTAALFKLDFLFAKSAYALEQDAAMPKMNRNGRIVIRRGRHPLIPKDKVVPIDFSLGGDYRCVVVTGPNTGGKTVTLKTIGLFVLMAQSGLFIPAASGSEISVFREVFADLGDEQSIEQSLSTFSSHMKNIVHILGRAKSSHLVLLDELGAGTDPVEGAALAVSILEDLRKRNISCIATTHYSELKLYALNTKGVINASCEFDVTTLMPTYRLILGIPGKSNAFEISVKLGLSEHVIENAKRFLSRKDMDFETTISELQRYRNELEKDRELAAEYRREAEELRMVSENLKREYGEKRDAFLREAKREAYGIIEKAKNEVYAIFEETKNITGIRERIGINAKINKLLEETQAVTDTPVISEPQNLKDFKNGDAVYIGRLCSEAEIIESADENGDVTVALGIMKMKLKSSEPASAVKVKRKSEGPAGSYASKTISIRTEIDVRGETLDDAVAMIDKYLDDAYISGLRTVTVIHGKGTGVLREGIGSYLRNHHHVETVRTGNLSEGGAGVTVVTLRRE